MGVVGIAGGELETVGVDDLLDAAAEGVVNILGGPGFQCARAGGDGEGVADVVVGVVGDEMQAGKLN